MKKITVLFLGLILIGLACSKGDDTFFECKIDGKSYKADGLLAYGIKDSDYRRFYGVVGEGSTQQSIIIWVPADVKSGDVITDKAKLRIDYTDASQISFSTFFSNEASGEVKIKAIDETEAEGTFTASMKGIDDPTKATKITDGKFKVVYR